MNILEGDYCGVGVTDGGTVFCIWIDLITHKQRKIEEMQTKIKRACNTQLEQQEQHHINTSQEMSTAISAISDTINHKLKKIEERQEDLLTLKIKLEEMQLENNINTNQAKLTVL